MTRWNSFVRMGMGSTDVVVHFVGGGTGSGFVPLSRQMVQVGQSIVEPHLDGRFAVVADGEPRPVADYVHRRMLGRVGEGELHRARNRAFGAERCTGWAANLEGH